MTVSVDTTGIRRAATRVREAADELTKALSTAGPSGSGPAGGWATGAAMGACADAVTGELRGLVDALTTEAERLDAAASRYDGADARAAIRLRYE